MRHFHRCTPRSRIRSADVHSDSTAEPAAPRVRRIRARAQDFRPAGIEVFPRTARPGPVGGFPRASCFDTAWTRGGATRPTGAEYRAVLAGWVSDSGAEDGAGAG